MSKDATTLFAKVQALQTQIAPYCEVNPRFQALHRALNEVQRTLQLGKLTLQIVSAHPGQFETILLALTQSSPLASLCQVVVSRQPKTHQIDGSLFLPGIRLQMSGQVPKFRLLKPLQTYQAGRADDCEWVLPHHCLFVSGHHAQFTYNAETSAWEIQDTSRNGTFVNGKRLDREEKRQLKTGDRILLGDVEDTPQNPVLIFEHPLEKIAPTHLDEIWRAYDLACFLYSYGNLPDATEQKTLATFQAQINKSDLYALIDVKHHQDFDKKTLEKDLKAFKQALKAQLNLSNSNIAHVFTDSITAQEQPEKTGSVSQKDYLSLMEKLRQRIEQRREAFLTSRLEPQIRSLENLTECLLKHEQAIAVNSDECHPEADPRFQQQMKQEINVIVQTLSTHRERTFEAIQAYIANAEKRLFDDFYADSFPCKLQDFAQRIKPEISKLEGKTVLQLRYPLLHHTASKNIPHPSQPPESSSPVESLPANTAMLQFCQEELTQWAHNVWLHVGKNLGENSLQALHSTILETLSGASMLNSDSLCQNLSPAALELDTSTIFDDNFTQINDQTVIKESSAIAYLLKKVRSQWMQFIFLFSFFSILGIAGRRQIMRHLMSPVINAFKASPIIVGSLLLVLIILSIRMGVSVYQKERDEGREKQANELRSKLCKHYQTLTQKHLTIHFIRSIKQALELEENQIERIEDFLSNHLTATTHAQRGQVNHQTKNRHESLRQTRQKATLNR